MKTILPSGIPPAEKSAVAVGLFDGLHLGHQKVIGAALSKKAFGFIPAVFTFQSPTLTTKGPPQLILSDYLKESLLSAMGVELFCAPDFGEFKELSPKEFITKLLVKTLNAGYVVCGEDFRFGKNAAGDVSALTELCKPFGIKIEVIPPVRQNGITVSSTQIREFIRHGELEQAKNALGRPFLLKLPVTHGNQIGRTLQFPTINQQPPPEQLLPPFGVYASSVEIDGKLFFSMTNIGVKPTIGGQSAPLAETNIFGFEGDLYGRTLTVSLYRFLRPEKKFSGCEALKEQLKSDVFSVKEFFEKGSIKPWKNE